MSKGQPRVVNPFTGKRVVVGGKIYKDLEKQGVVERPGATPPIQNFVYVPDQDIWIRKVGTKYDFYLQHGYIHDKKRDQLVKKNMLNVFSRVTTEEDKLAIGEKLLENRDVLGLILGYLCVYPTVYACFRLVCKRFKSVVDETANLLMLVDIVCERLLEIKDWVPRENVRRPEPRSPSTHAIFFSRHLNGSLPEKVALVYIHKYPELFMKNVDGARALTVCSRIVKRKDVDGMLLRDSILTWLHGECNRFRNANSGFVNWAKLKPLLLAIGELPRSLQNGVVPAYHTRTRVDGVRGSGDGVRRRTLLEHQQLAKRKGKMVLEPLPQQQAAVLPPIPPNPEPLQPEQQQAVGEMIEMLDGLIALAEEAGLNDD